MKMINKLVYSLLVLPFVVGGCEKKPIVVAPEADFTFSANNLKAPVNVLLTNTSQNATSYKWDFGNGLSSTETSPTVSYASGGVYTITLTAISTSGSNKITKTINIQNEEKKMPVADFSFSGTNLRAPVQVAFSNLSINSTSYSWDFGNGQNSTAASPSVKYLQGGTFTITLTATNVNGTNKITKTITVLKPYSKVGIEILTIDKYPATKPGGIDWDGSLSGTYPDIYFDIVKSSDFSPIYSLVVTSRKENLRTLDLPSSWKSSTAGTTFVDLIKDVDFEVDLFDYESLGGDEYIGSAEFLWSKISTLIDPYPSTIQSSLYDGTASQVGITLKLIWQE